MRSVTWSLHRLALCPFGRLIQLVLAEKRQAFELGAHLPIPAENERNVRTQASSEPALHHLRQGVMLRGSWSIIEYLEETCANPLLLPGTAIERAEIRRLVAFCEYVVFVPVTRPLLSARLLAMWGPGSRTSNAAPGGAALQSFLEYIDFLVETRRWLAGTAFSLADLAVAAHLSVLEYMGELDWAALVSARTWYSVIKSRPSFRPILAERIAGIDPPPSYDNVDA